MSVWDGVRQAREDIAAIQQGMQSQARVLDDQQAALTQLDRRLSTFEAQLAGIGERLEARLEEVRRAAGAADAGTQASLDKVRKSLKAVRRSDKGATQDLKKLIGRLTSLSAAFDGSIDRMFVDVAQPLMNSRRTMLGFDRLFTLWQAAGNVAHLDLPAAEIGTFRGGSAALLAQALQTFAGAPRQLHVVDTFEGHLDATFSDHDPDEQHGKFRNVTYEDVRDFLSAFAGVVVHKGDARTVVCGWPERRYSLIHIDVDLYRPTLDCLEYFGPRLVPGGILVMDDYEAPTCPGVSRAVHEYLDTAPAFQRWRLRAEQIVLVKR